MKYAQLVDRKIIILGFGSIGTAALFLILKHIDINPDQIIIISDNEGNRLLAEVHYIRFEHFRLTPENYESFLALRLNPNDILLNLSVGISCIDLISFCQQRDALYLDTSNEAWPAKTGNSRTTTYARRNKILQEKPRFINGPTALICHGANPGLVSHFAKRAVLDVATSGKRSVPVPKEPDEWGCLAQSIGIIALHISEYDSQYSGIKRLSEEYVNTWSIDGFLEEASENAGFAWGTHEIEFPKHFIKTRVDTQKCQVIELNQLGAQIELQSWIPSQGVFSGYLIPHPEAYSIAELLSQRQQGALYHPTVHFVYRPCQDALSSMHYSAAQGWTNVVHKRLLSADIVGGMDELGVLVIRQQTNEIYWFGSQLDIAEARRLLPHTNATSVQVAAGVLSGLVWLIENPRCGLVEPEDIDFERILEIASPYLGALGGHWSIWPERSNPKTTGEALKLKFQDLTSSVA